MILFDLLRSPSAYRDDWRAYARNQLGHALIVGAAPVVLLGPWFLLVTVLAYAAWEVVQWRRYGAEPSDCVEDAAFVIGAALIAALAAWPLFTIPAAFLVAGILWRRERADDRNEQITGETTCQS